MDLLTDLIGEDWWQDVALSTLETMRRTMRGLVRLIPAKHRGVVYADFEDELGELTHAELKGLEIGTDKSNFERKVRTYLRSHDDNLVVQKLLRGRQITSADLDELKNIFLDLGFGTEADIDRTAEEHEGLGLFLRAITGLSREAAVEAFSDFLRERTLSPAECAFVDLLIESLTQNGYLDVGELYEPPSSVWGTLTSSFAKLQTSMSSSMSSITLRRPPFLRQTPKRADGSSDTGPGISHSSCPTGIKVALLLPIAADGEGS